MSEKRVCSFFIGSKLFKERGTRIRLNAEDSKLNEENKNSDAIELKDKTVDSATFDQNELKALVSVDSEQTELKNSDFQPVDFDEQSYVDSLLAGYKEIKVETGDLLNSSNEQSDLIVCTHESPNSKYRREDNSNVSKRKRKRPTKRSKHATVKKDIENIVDTTESEHQDIDIKCEAVSKPKRKLERPSKLCKETTVKTEIAGSKGTRLSATELQENGFELKVDLGKGSKRKRRRPTKCRKDVSVKKRKYSEDVSNGEDESSDAKVHNKPLKKRERNILCTICGKRLASIYSLKRHAPIHEKPNLRCNVCGRKCIDERRYEVHMASHTGGKPYSCETCGGCFTSAAYLRIHRRIHTGDKPYFCEYCGKSFRGNPSLQAHLAVHSGLKKHSCEVCDKQFYKKSALRRHMLCHTGEKHYQCDVCGKYFRQNCALTVHKLIHTGEKNYPCPVCGTKFTQNSSVKVHMKIHVRGAMKSEDKLQKDAIL